MWTKKIVLLSPNDIVSYTFGECVSGVTYRRTSSPHFERQTALHTWIMYVRRTLVKIEGRARAIENCKMKIANEK